MKQYHLVIFPLLGAMTLFSLMSCASNSIATKPLPSPAASGAAAGQSDRSPASTPPAPAAQPAPLGTGVTLPTEGRLKSIAPSAPPSPQAGGLRADQQAELTALGIPVVIPTYLPPSFQASKVIANACSGASQRGACREGSSYTIVYRNPQNSCLIVNAIGGGVGGGAAEFEFRTSSTLLGDVMLLFGQSWGENKAPTPEQLRVVQPNLSSFPQQLAQPGSQRSPYYNVVAGESDYYQSNYGCGKNTSITPMELEKVVQSLGLLNVSKP